MSARDAIFGKIRRSLGVAANDVARRSIVIGRLEGAPKGVIPKRGQLPRDERIALFCKMAEKVSATVAVVDDPSAVPRAVAEYLRDRNLPAAARLGADPTLAAMPWSETQIEVTHGASEGHDAIGVSHALAAVAETGTLILTSGADNPTTLNFLPETHIVVLSADDVTGDLESVWPTIRARYGKGAMPRTVNMITGPSRSGDIEQTILLGAHGPRRLHIVIVG